MQVCFRVGGRERGGGGGVSGFARRLPGSTRYEISMNTWSKIAVNTGQYSQDIIVPAQSRPRKRKLRFKCGEVRTTAGYARPDIDGCRRGICSAHPPAFTV